jgi:hypothetical protein
MDDWFWQTLIILFIFIPLVLLWVYALVDLFTNASVSNVARVIWLVVIIFLPIFGALFYFLLRPAPEQGPYGV